MKSCVIFYHKNIFNIFQKRWVMKCIESILHQTYQDFDILELNYGNSDDNLINIFKTEHFGIQYIELLDKKNVLYWKEPLDDHSDAMNFLLDKAFLELGYDVVFNTNLDDFYNENRFLKQINEINMNNWDIVSSNFEYIKSDSDEDKHYKIMDVYRNARNMNDIRKELNKNHNVIAHPCVAYNKSFWRKQPDLCYHKQIPAEDLHLWQRGLKYDLRYCIIPDILLYYRIHGNQITKRIKR